MKRREFIALLGGMPATWPLTARAQQVKAATIGLLGTGSAVAQSHWTAAFVQRMRELGWVEGRNLALEFRWGQNDRDRIPELAADLIRRKVDVIATPGSAVGALAAKALTTSIPIVFSTSGDPVVLGLIPSLNKPGGNVTGFVDMSSELMPKRIGILHELLPRAARLSRSRHL